MTAHQPALPIDPYRLIATFAKQPPKTSILVPDPPFPLHTLPPSVAAWLQTLSSTTRVPLSLTATPFLACTGSTIGRQLRLQVGPGWFERPALWVALITLTGIGKTPAIAAVRQPFDQLHHEAWTAWQERLAIWKDAPQPRPPRPGMDHLVTTSGSIHALTRVLGDSTGLVLLRDELYGLVRAMDRRGGEDRQQYLSLWSSEPIIPAHPDLASHILSPVVGIVGGLQPTLLHKIRQKDQDGFLERFLMVFSAGSSGFWNENAPVEPTSPTGSGPVLEILRALRSIDADRRNLLGLDVTLTGSARAIWVEWFNENSDQTVVASLSVGGFYRKMPSHLARLALIIHTLWHPHEPGQPLSADTLFRAIDLVEFYRVHIHRSITLIGEIHPLRTPAVSLGERILRILGGTTEPDGWLSRSSLLVALGRPETAAFNQIIDTLIENALLQTRTVRNTGRPATHYRLPR